MSDRSHDTTSNPLAGWSASGPIPLAAFGRMTVSHHLLYAHSLLESRPTFLLIIVATLCVTSTSTRVEFIAVGIVGWLLARRWLRLRSLRALIQPPTPLVFMGLLVIGIAALKQVIWWVTPLIAQIALTSNARLPSWFTEGWWAPDANWPLIITIVATVIYARWLDRHPADEIARWLEIDGLLPPADPPRKRPWLAASLQCLPLMRFVIFQYPSFPSFWTGDSSLSGDNPFSMGLILAMLGGIAFSFIGPILWGLGYLYIGERRRVVLIVLLAIVIPSAMLGGWHTIFDLKPWGGAAGLILAVIAAADAWWLAATRGRPRPRGIPTPVHGG